MTDDELKALADAAEEQAKGQFARRARSINDFRYDEIQEKYWDTTTGQLLAARSVDGAIPETEWPTRPDKRTGNPIPVAPSKAINAVTTGLTVEGSTWWPGLPRYIQDKVITDRGPLDVKGAVTYNTYVAPDHSNLRYDQNPDMWINHVKFLFPDPVEHEHFFDFAAHMIQKPHEKINHGIVIAGKQGIGKDTMLLPLRYGVGEWNVAEIDPDAITRQYNPYVKSVMLMINEVRPLDGEHKSSNFYNQLKPLLAAPPEMLPMEMKYANVIYVRNLAHVILTTNDLLTMYIPPEDRRLFVMNSPIPDPKVTPVFAPEYFENMYEYLMNGGIDAVVNWLKNRNVNVLDAGAPPKMTSGKAAAIESAHLIRRSLADEIIEEFNSKTKGLTFRKVVFAKDILDFIRSSNLFDDRERAIKAVQAKNFHFKMEEHGFEPLKNPEASEWRCGKFRSRVAFVDKSIPYEDRVVAALEELERRPLTFEPF